MKIFLFFYVLLMITSCTHSPNNSITSKQVKFYDGYAFDVHINNQKVVFFKDKKTINPLIHDYIGSASSILWKLDAPIKGALDFRVEAKENSQNYIGHIDKEQLKVTIFPLNKIYLPNHKIDETHNDILINGTPLNSKINLLETMVLPTGDYIIAIKVKGHKNWDKKEIYVQVRADKIKQNAHKMASKKTWYALALGKFSSHINGLSTERIVSMDYDEKFKKLNKEVEYYKEKRDYAKALSYQKKLTFTTKEHSNKKHIVLADMYNNLALRFKDNEEYEEALKYNLKSLEIKLKYHPKEYVAISTNYDNMGSIYFVQGKYALAIKHLKKSLALREKYFPKNAPDLADSYNNLGILFQSIGNRKEALFYLKKALRIRQINEGETGEQTASIYSSMGSLYDENKQYKKALKYHKKSILILEKNLKNKEQSDLLFSAYQGIAILFHKLHSYKLALFYHEKSLKIQKNIKSEESLKTAQVYNNMSVSHMMSKEFNKSKVYLTKAINIKKKLLGEKSTFLTEEYENLGWLYFNMKEYKQAFFYAKKSMDIFLEKREAYFPILNASENEHFVKNSEDKIDLLFQSAYELGTKQSYVESFSYWIQYKGSVFENENKIQRLYYRTKDEETKKEIRSFLKYKRKLGMLYQKKSEQHSLSLIKEYENKISSLKEKLALNKENNVMEFSTLVSKLKDSELYIDFAKIGKYYFGFAINAKGKIFFRRISIMHGHEIDALIVEFRKSMKSMALDSMIQKKALKHGLSRLYDLLLKTLLESLSTKESDLIISSNGLLSQLPFEALYRKNKKHYLIEEKNIRYISSAKEFLQDNKSRKKDTSSHKIIIFSNPDFDREVSSPTRGGDDRMFNMHFSSLPKTEEEAYLIKNIIGLENVVEYKGEMANEANFLKVKQPKILHVATHGFFIKQELSNPMLNAGIALSGANSALKEGRGNGVITALKLSGLDLEGTELVVLSACKTALVGVNSADSVSVLSKAFIQAGASSIVGSLWSVSDEGTRDLMQLFYENIHNKNTYMMSLKKTKVEMIKNNVSPAVWASFILHGDK